MKKLKKNKSKKLKKHQDGDKHFIDGVECEVRFINAGAAYCFPTHDDEDEPLVARHICFARIDDEGKIRLF